MKQEVSVCLWEIDKSELLHNPELKGRQILISEKGLGNYYLVIAPESPYEFSELICDLELGDYEMFTFDDFKALDNPIKPPEV